MNKTLWSSMCFVYPDPECLTISITLSVSAVLDI